MPAAFAGFPYWWVQYHLHRFDARHQRVGVHLAALKVYLGLALDAKYGSWVTRSSLSSLEETCGLSRPSVIAGRDKLYALGLIRVKTNCSPFEYQLVQADDSKQFIKIPKPLLLKNLREISSRGVTTLNALKIYYTLLSLRVNKTNRARIGHIALVDRTGMQPRQVRRALDVLYSNELIHVHPPGASGSHYWGENTNEYLLLGLEGQG